MGSLDQDANFGTVTPKDAENGIPVVSATVPDDTLSEDAAYLIDTASQAVLGAPWQTAPTGQG